MKGKTTVLGDIPESWDSVKLGEVFKLKSGDGLSKSDAIEGNYPVYGGNGITNYHNSYNQTESKLTIGRVGAKCGCIHRTEQYSWITDNALIIDEMLIDTNSSFIEYILNQIDLNKYANKNAQPVISGGKIYPLRIPIPPLPEQQKIADILSTVDAKIEVIDQQITETQELKKGLMQRLLTKGIGHTEFKDSPLGEIPKSWKVMTGEEISTLITKGASPKWQGFDYQDKGMLFVTSENVRSGLLNISNPKFLPIEFNEKVKKSELVNGDILINIVGASIGRSCMYASKFEYANINQAICLLRIKDSISAEFILHFLQGNDTINKLLDAQNGSARQNLSLTDIRRFKFLIPNREEQKDITEILSCLDNKLKVLLEKKINYQKLKKGLMQKLLTGKIRITNLLDKKQQAI